MKSILIVKSNALKLKAPITNCGIYNPQKSEFPITGGSGPEQSIQTNDAFILSKKITIENNLIPAYTLLVSAVNNPTQDISHWILLEGESLKRQELDEYLNPTIFTRLKKFVSKLWRG